MVSYDQLDREQVNFIENDVLGSNSKITAFSSGNFWIDGFPGSGKSIVLVHSLAAIKKKNPDAEILITSFTHSLLQLYKVGISELKINAARVTFSTYLEFECKPKKYDYIFCDEVQDLTESAILTMKNNCGRLIIAGDPNQSIYDKNPRSNEPVVDVTKIESISSCKKITLGTIHRLTKSVIALINAFMPTMDIFKAKNNALNRDVSVRLGSFDSKEDEVSYIVNNSCEACTTGKSAGILLPTHDDILNFINIYCTIKNHDTWRVNYNNYGKPNYAEMNKHVHSLGIHYVGNGYGNLLQAMIDKKTIIMTYHSAKGLDFDNVYIPFLDSDTVINGEAIFMVALSRSKEFLTLTHSKAMHKHLSKIENMCSPIIFGTQDNDIFDFDF